MTEYITILWLAALGLTAIGTVTFFPGHLIEVLTGYMVGTILTVTIILTVRLLHR